MKNIRWFIWKFSVQFKSPRAHQRGVRFSLNVCSWRLMLLLNVFIEREPMTRRVWWCENKIAPWNKLWSRKARPSPMQAYCCCCYCNYEYFYNYNYYNYFIDNKHFNKRYRNRRPIQLARMKRWTTPGSEKWLHIKRIETECTTYTPTVS